MLEQETQSDRFQTTEINQELVGKQSTLNEMLQKIPEIVEIKFLSSSVKLMREAGHRTLTVTLQLIHAEMKQDLASDTDFSTLISSLSLQDLVVTSGHTKFTSLAKAAVKLQVEGKRAVDSSIHLSSLHVDHHHDELYYWLDLLPASASKKTSVKKSKFSPQNFIDESLQLHLVIELEDILVVANFPGCCPFGGGLTHSRVTTDCFVDVSDQIHSSSPVKELSVELLFEMAWCRVKDKNIFDVTFQKKCHYWSTPLGLGMILFKVRDYPSDFKVQCMVENLQVEWNPDLGNLIRKLTPFFKTDLNSVSDLSDEAEVSSSAVEKDVMINHSSRIMDKSFFSHTLQLSFKNTSLYAVTEEGPGLIMQFDSITLDTASEKLFVSLEGVKMVSIATADQPVFCQRSSDIKNSVLHLKTVHLTYKNHSKKEVNFQLLDEITGLWSTDLHMTTFTLAKELLALMTFFKGERKSSEPNTNSQERSLFNIHTRLRGNVHFGAVLSSTHRMSVKTVDFTANFHPQRASAQTDHFVILFDECPIFSLNELNISINNEGERHLVNRQSFEGLEKKQNKVT
ncbi:protein KIAA0100-like, partial [Limulus polyphemus]|uniref:Protein KIAA0100-like n=1 Tax=Limulus polyphemus TaxID=6850 RepID=A0ABM1SR48_LIMPO